MTENSNNNNNFLEIVNFDYFDDQEKVKNNNNKFKNQTIQDNRSQEKYIPKRDYDGVSTEFPFSFLI